MTEENKNFLSQLLVLKTGIAMIAVEAEKIQSLENEISEKNKKLEAANSSIDTVSTNLNNLSKKVSEEKQAITTYAIQKRLRKLISLFFILGSLFLAFVAPILEFLSFKDYNTLKPEELVQFLKDWLVKLIIAVIFFIIWIIIKIRNKRNPLRQPSTYYTKSYKQNKKTHETQMLEMVSTKDNLTQEIASAKERFTSVCETSIPLIQIIYETLYKNYNDVLRVRDWEYIDLIFHYIDSERADNKKEALLLVDKQKQTEEIVHAVNNATAEICRSIRYATDLIQFNMDNHFKNLSTQLAVQHSQMMGAMSQTAASISSLSSKLSDISSQSAMQTALLKKNNESSQKLVQSMNNVMNDMKDVSSFARKYR